MTIGTVVLIVYVIIAVAVYIYLTQSSKKEQDPDPVEEEAEFGVNLFLSAIWLLVVVLGACLFLVGLVLTIQDKRREKYEH